METFDDTTWIHKMEQFEEMTEHALGETKT